MKKKILAYAFVLIMLGLIFCGTKYKKVEVQPDLPSLFIEIDGGNEAYQSIVEDATHETGFPGHATIIDVEGKSVTADIKEIRGRGNVTWSAPKKPFQIKFDEKISVLGMKESKTWILLASYTDGTALRNAVTYQFAREFGIDYAVESQLANVYINDTCMGVYLVTSKVEVGRNRIDIGDGVGDNNDFLLEIDNTIDDYQFETDRGYVMKVHSPKLKDMNQSDAIDKMNSIQSVIDQFEDVLYKDGVTYEELSKLIDMDSFAKFYWVQEYFENYDFMVGSCFLYYTDDLIHMGPVWDMDNTLNRSYVYADPEEYYSFSNSKLAIRRKADWYGELFKLQEFSDLVDKYFLDNKALFSTLSEKVDVLANEISNSLENNFDIWTYDQIKEYQGRWVENENNYKDAIENYKNSLDARYNFYSREYKD
ncbi:MAG: CotH kinase family protein [Bacillota bacterium]|nr:CotH kinase family protein [Bacillota bacterium]